LKLEKSKFLPLKNEKRMRRRVGEENEKNFEGEKQEKNIWYEFG
jgi:hypothetical protein